MTTQMKGVKPSKRKSDKDPELLAEEQERGARIKALREASGLTTQQFAIECGVTEVTQYNYERAERTPDANYLAKLYYRFAVDLGPLITGAPRAKAAKAGKLSETGEDLVRRYEGLPPRMRKTVEDVVLLAWLAHQDRKNDQPGPPGA